MEIGDTIEVKFLYRGNYYTTKGFVVVCNFTSSFAMTFNPIGLPMEFMSHMKNKNRNEWGGKRLPCWNMIWLDGGHEVNLSKLVLTEKNNGLYGLRV